MAIRSEIGGGDLVHLHFYTYNPSFDSQLPRFIAKSRSLTSHVLRRISVAFGYLPSWRSPALSLRIEPVRDDLPNLHLSGTRTKPWRNELFRAAMMKIIRGAPLLDLWPLVPMLAVSAPGKSYHWGGTFPHVGRQPASVGESDLLGRVPPWTRIHLVDGSVLPSLASTTYTLTVMANAHRIADAALRSD
jgi:hypothetical protein